MRVLVTNGRRALLFKNIAILTQVGYTILAKEAIQSGVNEFDFMWLRSLVSFFHAFIILKIYGVPLYKGELSENAKMRKMLFLRSRCCQYNGLRH